MNARATRINQNYRYSEFLSFKYPMLNFASEVHTYAQKSRIRIDNILLLR